MLTFPAEGKLFLGGLINKCGGKVLQGCYLILQEPYFLQGLIEEFGWNVVIYTAANY